MRKRSLAILSACAACGSGSPSSDDATPTSDRLCGPLWSAACTIEDEECRDPEAGPRTPVQTYVATEVDDQLRLWRDRDGCGPYWVDTCDGGLVGVVFYGGLETPDANVYDASTGAWVGAFEFRDDISPGDLCGSRVWIGDPRARSCALAGLAWMQAQSASCTYLESEPAPACDPGCIHDGR